MRNLDYESPDILNEIDRRVAAKKARKTRKNIYQVIYSKLEKLGVLETEEYQKMKSAGYMDFHIDRLSKDVYAIAHNYIQNGDVMPDPDMQIRINREYKTAEALTFQNAMFFQKVYPSPGMVNPRAKKEQNSFLNTWLTNLKNQGFGKSK